MAITPDELNLQQQSNLPPDILAQQQALNRQQQMAQLLMQQGQQQPQGQMVSGRYVPTSFFQNLLPVVQTGLGAYKAKQAETEGAKLAEELRKGREEERRTAAELIKSGKVADVLSTPNVYGGATPFMSAAINATIPKTPEKVAEYNFAVQNGFKGSYNDFANQMTPYQKAQLGLENAKFAFEKEQAAGGAKLTESQSNATGFGVRAKESNAILNQLENKGVQHPGVIRQTATGAVQNIPIIGKTLENAVGSTLNVLPGAVGGTNADQQSFLAAKKNFITAVLRKESGASISPSEFETEEKKYFAQIGDDANTVRQKQHARETAIKALKFQAGPGARFIDEFQPQTDFSAESTGGWRVK